MFIQIKYNRYTRIQWNVWNLVNIKYLLLLADEKQTKDNCI